MKPKKSKYNQWRERKKLRKYAFYCWMVVEIIDWSIKQLDSGNHDFKKPVLTEAQLFISRQTVNKLREGFKEALKEI